MGILRDEVPEFATAAVCRQSRKEEIVVDLIDAGVTKQAAQRMVDELLHIHDEFRAEQGDGLQEKLLQAWLSRGTPLEFMAIPEPSAPSNPQPPAVRPTPRPLACLRCDCSLDYLGTRSFETGESSADFVSALIGSFLNWEHFDVYVCPNCGRVELFVNGIGEQFRPH